MTNGFRVKGCGDISRSVKPSRQDEEAAEEMGWLVEGEKLRNLDVNGGVSESFVMEWK